MTSDPFARSRLRKVLVAVILATIPCYCAGLVAVLLSPGRSQQRSTTPTIAASWTPVVFATQTSTYTFTPGIPTSTFTPSQTPTITTTPTITLTPTITQTPTASTSPTPTNTAFIPPTFTKTPPFTVTYTITPTPTSTTTPLPTNTNTPLPTATDTPTPDLSLTIIPAFIPMLNGIP